MVFVCKQKQKQTSLCAKMKWIKNWTLPIGMISFSPVSSTYKSSALETATKAKRIVSTAAFIFHFVWKGLWGQSTIWISRKKFWQILTSPQVSGELLESVCAWLSLPTIFCFSILTDRNNYILVCFKVSKCFNCFLIFLLNLYLK